MFRNMNIFEQILLFAMHSRRRMFHIVGQKSRHLTPGVRCFRFASMMDF
jgi:hypothetical protein